MSASDLAVDDDPQALGDGLDAWRPRIVPDRFLPGPGHDALDGSGPCRPATSRSPCQLAHASPRPSGHRLESRRAVGAAAGDRQVGDVDREAAPALERRRPAPAASSASISQVVAAADAVQVAVDRRRQDVELLAAVGAVAVAEQAELLEDVERPVDGRGDRARVDLAAALDELGAGHVAVGLRQDLDQRPALRRPAQAARAQPVADAGPARASGAVADRSGSRVIVRKHRSRPQRRLNCNPLRYRPRLGYAFPPATREPHRMFDLIGATAAIAPTAVDLGVLLTGLLLGIRHGIDWDHIAAITDITSTTAAAGMADAAHAGQHRDDPRPHATATAATREMRAHDAGPGGATPRPALADAPGRRSDASCCRARATRSGSGRSTRSATAPSSSPSAWPPSRSGPCCPTGSTRSWAGSSASPSSPSALWVMYSVYRYARAGERFRLRSRWMLVFDAIRYGWRRLQARLHGHEHVEPLEMSSYGARTSFGVGMIHGVGAETGTQVLLIAAVGGASSAGLGVPMLFAFVLGLLISNFAIVLLSSVGFVSSQAREQLYVAVGAVAGLFSLFVGTIFLFGLDGTLPDLGAILPF